MDQYLQHVKADVIFAMFGYNESFDGPQKADNHKNLLIDFVGQIRSYQPNGKKASQNCFIQPNCFPELKES